MAGEIPLPAQEAPDFNPGCACLSIPIATSAVNQYWLYCERDTILDAVHLRFTEDGGADADVMLEKVPDGTEVTSGTDLLTAVVSLTDADDEDDNLTGTIDQTANLIPAGNWIAVYFTGTQTGLIGLSIYIRFRTRVR